MEGSRDFGLSQADIPVRGQPEVAELRKGQRGNAWGVPLLEQKPHSRPPALRSSNKAALLPAGNKPAAWARMWQPTTVTTTEHPQFCPCPGVRLLLPCALQNQCHSPAQRDVDLHFTLLQEETLTSPHSPVQRDTDPHLTPLHKRHSPSHHSPAQTRTSPHFTPLTSSHRGTPTCTPNPTLAGCT